MAESKEGTLEFRFRNRANPKIGCNSPSHSPPELRRTAPAEANLARFHSSELPDGGSPTITKWQEATVNDPLDECFQKQVSSELSAEGGGWHQRVEEHSGEVLEGSPIPSSIFSGIINNHIIHSVEWDIPNSYLQKDRSPSPASSPSKSTPYCLYLTTISGPSAAPPSYNVCYARYETLLSASCSWGSL
ncbi:hypothetical protein Scep_023740 [Stephania cephalantha]|uniref:Uncharacterized protein n=1 Tax=Stephania cephalantha TaxID=152367 RepID=A0AAP0EY00_9MAGN